METELVGVDVMTPEMLDVCVAEDETVLEVPPEEVTELPEEVAVDDGRSEGTVENEELVASTVEVDCMIDVCVLEDIMQMETSSI